MPKSFKSCRIRHYLLAFTVFVSLAFSSFAAAETGQVRVRLENKTEGSTARLEDIEVRLFAFEEANQLFEETAYSGAKGDHLFSGVPMEAAHRYIVSALFQGVIYVAHGEIGEGQESTLDVSVPVYESTGTLSGIGITNFHLVVTPGEGGVGYSVSEILVVENTSDKSIIGSRNSTTTLQFDVPEGIQNFSVVEGVLNRHIGLGNGIVAYSGPLLPGETRMVFSYTIPDVASWFYRRRFPVPIKQVGVFTPETGVNVVSNQLEQVEVVDIEGKSYNRYEMTENALLSGGLMFEVKGGSGGSSQKSGQSGETMPDGVGFMASALLGLYVAYSLIKPLFTPAPKSLTGPGEYVTKKEARRLDLLRLKRLRLDAVEEIDQDYEAGKLSDDDYNDLRGKYKNKAMAVLQALDSLEKEMQQGQGKVETPPIAVSASEADEAGKDADPPKTGVFCHACGAPTQEGDRFCSGCGEPLRGPTRLSV